MSAMQYDYPALKDAHGKLVAAVENYESNTKQLDVRGSELVAENTADGVKSTQEAFQTAKEAEVKVMYELIDQVAGVLSAAKEFHVANGGVE